MVQGVCLRLHGPAIPLNCPSACASSIADEAMKQRRRDGYRGSFRGATETPVMDAGCKLVQTHRRKGIGNRLTRQHINGRNGVIESFTDGGGESWR